MNDTTQLILPVLSALGGGLLTAFTTFLTNRQKIKEIELEYKHKLDEVYRSNARQYIDPLYKPLNRILTRLEEQYIVFLRGRYAYEKEEDIDRTDEEILKSAIEDFFSSLSLLLSDGDSGYLTPELDKALLDFNRFLRQSLYAKESRFVLDKLPLETQALILLYRPFLPFFRRKVREKIEEQLTYPLAAPIGSVGFRNRFFYNVRKIRDLIREVMLKNNVVNPV